MIVLLDQLKTIGSLTVGIVTAASPNIADLIGSEVTVVDHSNCVLPASSCVAFYGVSASNPEPHWIAAYPLESGSDFRRLL